MSSDNNENPHENEDYNQDKTFFGFNLFDEAKENFTQIQIQFEDKNSHQILSNLTKYKRETLAEVVIKLKKPVIFGSHCESKQYCRIPG